MLIQVNTDNHIVGREKLVTWVQDEVTDALDRFAPQLTRVEVYLADMSSNKSTANDMKCTIEARLAGLDPIAVTKTADTLNAALDMALEVATQTIDGRLSKLHENKGRVSMGGDQTI